MPVSNQVPPVSQSTAYNFVAGAGDVKLVKSSTVGAEPQYFMGEDGQMTLVADEATINSLLDSLDESRVGDDVFVGGDALSKLVKYEARHDPGSQRFQSLENAFQSGVTKIHDDYPTAFMQAMEEASKASEAGMSYANILARLKRGIVRDALDRARLGADIGAHSMTVSFDASMDSVEALEEKGKKLEAVRMQRVGTEIASGVAQAGIAGAGGYATERSAQLSKEAKIAAKAEAQGEFRQGGELEGDAPAMNQQVEILAQSETKSIESTRMGHYATQTQVAAQATAGLINTGDTSAQIDGQVAENAAQMRLTTNQTEIDVAKDKKQTGDSISQGAVGDASNSASSLDRVTADMQGAIKGMGNV